MSNWTNSDFQATARTELDFRRSRIKHPPNKKVRIAGAKPLSQLVNKRMEQAIKKGPSTTVGQFAFVKTLFRGARGNTWIARQEFNISPAWPMGAMPSGSRGVIAYPAR